MKRIQTVVLLAALAVLLQGATSCNKLKARDRLNKGVQAYKAARYEDAIERFKEAVELFMRMSKSAEFDEFLSLPAYELLP